MEVDPVKMLLDLYQKLNQGKVCARMILETKIDIQFATLSVKTDKKSAGFFAKKKRKSPSALRRSKIRAEKFREKNSAVDTSCQVSEMDLVRIGSPCQSAGHLPSSQVAAQATPGIGREASRSNTPIRGAKRKRVWSPTFHYEDDIHASDVRHHSDGHPGSFSVPSPLAQLDGQGSPLPFLTPPPKYESPPPKECAIPSLQPTNSDTSSRSSLRPASSTTAVSISQDPRKRSSEKLEFANDRDEEADICTVQFDNNGDRDDSSSVANKLSAAVESISPLFNPVVDTELSSDDANDSSNVANKLVATVKAVPEDATALDNTRDIRHTDSELFGAEFADQLAKRIFGAWILEPSEPMEVVIPKHADVDNDNKTEDELNVDSDNETYEEDKDDQLDDLIALVKRSKLKNGK